MLQLPGDWQEQIRVAWSLSDLAQIMWETIADDLYFQRAK